MAEVRKSVLIEYSAGQMFRLVDEVEDYPRFLPWCGGTQLIHRDETRTVAALRIDYHGIKADFSTENDKEAPHLMNIKLRHGPFKHLDGCWRFTPLGDAACKIEFRLRYEFSSKLLEKALGPVFHHIANTFVDAFVKRAAAVYP
ncbi:MAG: type II toxin-antitoxin system RatA family toxin [Zoogloeaceae bacterium]|jgi:ribosome-associated toxin RatA of RatAB toxin-antitoxin module|nr:type II toxin-antitoxin system RatA family toxin [Zoogloeaceae bacterium]